MGLEWLNWSEPSDNELSASTFQRFNALIGREGCVQAYQQPN
jgi:hypothetical protein